MVVEPEPAAGLVLAVVINAARRPQEPRIARDTLPSDTSVAGHRLAVHRIVVARPAAILFAVDTHGAHHLKALHDPVDSLEVLVIPWHPDVEADGAAVLVRVAARRLTEVDRQNAVDLARGLDAVERVALVLKLAGRRADVSRGRQADGRRQSERRRGTGRGFDGIRRA